MERWDSSLRQDHNRHRHRRDNPSFSSSLLDAIYRSIDDGNGADHGEAEGEGEGEGEGEVIFYRQTMRKKQSGSGLKEEEKMVNFRRACLIEKWMEKKVSEKVVVRRSSVADLERKSRHHHHREIPLLNSSSSSSESSSGCGGFSSSESESLRRPKPIRTSLSAPLASENPQFGGGYSRYGQYVNSAPMKHQIKSSKHESGFGKTKSKAMKIYGDLKKVKQPISPGGRLASFLNSLFTAGNAKKAKIVEDLNNPPPQRNKSKSTNASTCSSASSFSRSCLSNTPSSRGKFSDGGAKRSVRFCPVSVIVDEDCRPCGHKSLHEDREPALMALTAVRDSVEDRRRVQEVAIDLLKSYQKKNGNDTRNGVVEEFDMRDVVRRDDNAFDHVNDDDDDEEEEEYDDAASYSSSDLFELDNLSAIGIERYREELPVYETTHFDTNRAIANGLIL